MWQSREGEEKQKKLEKLIDWELRRQLTWVALLLTTFLGLMQLLVRLELWRIDLSKFPLICINVVKPPFVILFFLLLSGVDISFYKLATTLERVRNWELRIPNDFMQQELKNYPFRKLYEHIFLIRTCENRMTLRKWLVYLLIIILDIVLIWASISI